MIEDVRARPLINVGRQAVLFMVIETFSDTERVRKRFERDGRMLPEGVTYHASWIDPAANRCFQVMEAADQEALNAWTARWNDLIEFEVVPVLTSAQFWSRPKS
jgi:hypothetical protein